MNRTVEKPPAVTKTNGSVTLTVILMQQNELICQNVMKPEGARLRNGRTGMFCPVFSFTIATYPCINSMIYIRDRKHH